MRIPANAGKKNPASYDAGQIQFLTNLFYRIVLLCFFVELSLHSEPCKNEGRDNDPEKYIRQIAQSFHILECPLEKRTDTVPNICHIHS
jgi:hypothetical protein